MTDILSTIDDAVEQRCACGCGRHLRHDGPSMWFASDECQTRWSEQHAHNPREVTGRPDVFFASRRPGSGGILAHAASIGQAAAAAVEAMERVRRAASFVWPAPETITVTHLVEIAGFVQGSRAAHRAVVRALDAANRRPEALSARELAERAAAIGASALTRRAISKIECGARGVSVEEWLQLAHVLGIPPVDLLLDPDGRGVEVAPGAVLHPQLVRQWFGGPVSGADEAFAAEVTVETPRFKVTLRGNGDPAELGRQALAVLKEAVRDGIEEERP